MDAEKRRDLRVTPFSAANSYLSLLSLGVSVFCMILIFVNVGASSFSKQTIAEEQRYIVSPWKTLSTDISVYSGRPMLTYLVRNGSTIYTASGNPVNALTLDPMSQAEIDYINGIMTGHINNPNFELIWEPGDDIITNLYNCHYFAWCRDWCAQEYWVDHNEVNKFINDHSTVRVLPSNVQVGDKVVYYSEGAPIHSAVVYSISGNEITCQSKWGEGYIFIHKLDKVPLEYYDQDDGTRFLNVEYYRYTHPDHEHSLYVLSESGVSKVIRCNESDCTYYAVCTHLSTYTDLSALEHTRTCSNGGFVFAEWHDSDVVASDNLYYHNIECLDCRRLIDTENHDWVSTGSLYSCSVCGMTSAVVPEIMRNLTNDEINLLLSTMSNDETDALLLALNDADRKRVTDALAPIENDDNVTE